MPPSHFDPKQTDWNLIRCFVAVVEHGSLTRAAEHLGLSQPTLSRQIAGLELAIGAPLFERVARGLRLTVAGEALVEPARHMMAAARALGMAAASQDDALRGTVRITASEMTAAFALPPMIAQLGLAYPDIQIELVASNQISNLLEREADIAIRMIRPTQSALIARHIGAWPLGFHAHKSYFDNSALPIPGKAGIAASDIRDLAKYRWIGYDQSDQLIAGFRAAGMPVDRSFFAFRSDNHLINWQALLSGAGIGICARWLAKRHPELVQIMHEQSLPALPIWLTTHRELNSNKKIRVVFDFLADALTKVAPRQIVT